LGSTGHLALCSERVQLIVLTGVTLAAPAASACSSSRPLLSPSAWARVKPIALTGVTLAAARNPNPNPNVDQC
jgi:hypothetical protein